MENAIVRQDGLESTALNVNALKTNTEMTATKPVNAKVRTQSYVIHMMESASANKAGAARLAIDLVPS